MSNEDIEEKIKQEKAKKVKTFDLKGKENGFLVELFKNKQKTLLYLTCTKPGAFKGYHLHKIRASRYICIKGKIKIILYINGKKKEYILSADNPQRLYIPPMVPTGILNIGNEEAWLINFPLPSYDPNLKDEQIDFTEEELKSKDYKKRL